METLLPIRRRASQHPRRANRSPRGTRPSCTLTARPCSASVKIAIASFPDPNKNPQPRFNRNQQYSITAVSDGGGSVVERYAYSACGQVTIADGAGSQISNSGISNRFMFAGREWDEGLSLYHYRARMYDPVSGRFVSRDPIGFYGQLASTYSFCGARACNLIDPSGNRGVQLNLGPDHPAETPWSFWELADMPNSLVLGSTQINIDVQCSCTQDPQYTYVSGCAINVDFFIHIDQQSNIDANRDWRETLGHEQRHVENMMARIRRLALLLEDILDGLDCCLRSDSDADFETELCELRAQHVARWTTNRIRNIRDIEGMHLGIPERSEGYPLLPRPGNPVFPIRPNWPEPPAWAIPERGVLPHRNAVSSLKKTNVFSPKLFFF